MSYILAFAGITIYSELPKGRWAMRIDAATISMQAQHRATSSNVMTESIAYRPETASSSTEKNSIDKVSLSNSGLAASAASSSAIEMTDDNDSKLIVLTRMIEAITDPCA
jgi:hypothetical protein